MSHLDEIQAYADEHGMVTVVCRNCGHIRHLDASSYKSPGKSSRINITCYNCGNDFPVSINFRKHYRKETNLSGTCTTRNFSELGQDAGAGEFSGIIVKNISRSGMGFIVKSPIRAAEGDILNVRFALDDTKRSVISKKVIVRRIIDNYIASEFTSRIDHSDKDLSFYLMF